MPPRLALAPLAFALVACSPPPALAPVAPPTRSAPAPAPAPEPAEATAPEAPEAPPRAPSPFHVVTRLAGAGSSVTLSPLGGHAFVLVDGTVLDIEGDDLRYDPKKQRGLEKFGAESVVGRLIGAGGVWPKAAWVATVEVFGRGGTSVLYRWERSRWVARGGGHGNATLVGFAPWSKGRTLALFSPDMTSDARFDVISGPPAPAPRATRSKARDPWPCATRLRPVALAALGSGEVFMLGVTCQTGDDEGEPAWAVERWAPGARAGAIDELPQLTSIEALVALAPDEVYVAGTTDGRARRPLLLRFDGATWEPAPPPGDGKSELSHLSASPEGTLYALADGAVWSRPRGGAWGQITLPATDDGALRAEQLWARADGDLWVLAGQANRPAKDAADPAAGTTLLHTRPPTRPFAMPAR